MKKNIFQALLSCLPLLALGQTQTVGLINRSGTDAEGYVLFAPINNTTTYLIDKCGKEVHNWSSSSHPGQAVYLLESGDLLRTGNANNASFNAGGTGGIIEKMDWDGNVTWSYTISDASQCQHHDIQYLPNGNILAIVWESKTSAEAVAAGRNPASLGSVLWSEKIIELQPSGNNSATIVWEWHAWDHLMQNYDNTQSNYYTSILQHPELINLNYKATPQEDWLHINAVDYNSTFDQVLISVHNFNEVWIIDHSTSTAQAATHTGGNSGKGGDLLYRWGNPFAYKAGSVSDQKLFGQHNAHWIESGLPNADAIMIFNNGTGRSDGDYSSVDIITPPVDGSGVYTYNAPYGPTSSTWTYTASNKTDFYSANISGAQQLANGDVLICAGASGTFFEVDAGNNTVWEYINPVGTSIASQGSTATQNIVFRSPFYSSSYSGFSGHTLTAGSPIEKNAWAYSCDLSTSVEMAKSKNTDVVLFPNPVDRTLNILNVSDLVKVTISNVFGQIVKTEMLSGNYSVDVSSLSNGLYFASIYSGDKQSQIRFIVER